MYNQSRVATLLSASGIRSEDLIRAWTSMSTIELNRHHQQQESRVEAKNDKGTKETTPHPPS